MDIILWLIVIVGYVISVYCIYRVYIFAFSLFNEAPFVSSNSMIIELALNELDIKDGDNFIDIGSGDGRVIFRAYNIYSKRNINAKYCGIDISNALILQSKLKSKILGVSKYVSFHKIDAMEYNYTQYNKVFMYMTTQVTSKIMFKIHNQLPKGSRVVSAVFSFGEFGEGKKIEEKRLEINNKKISIYIWNKE